MNVTKSTKEVKVIQTDINLRMDLEEAQLLLQFIYYAREWNECGAAGELVAKLATEVQKHVVMPVPPEWSFE